MKTGHAMTGDPADAQAHPHPDALGALMAAAQAGDGAAYRDVLGQSTRLLRRAFGVRAPWLTAEDIEDLVQETLLSLHRARASYDPARPFIPWLMAIARHRLADHLRREGRRHHGARAHAVHDETFAPAAAKDHADGVLDTLALQDAMRTLPQGQREAVRLLRLRQLPLAEAARACGAKPTALKVALHRAAHRLRAAIGGGQ